MSRTKTGLKSCFNFEKNGFYSEKTGFFFLKKLVSFIFIISSKTENILSLELQCINLPTGNTTTLKKNTLSILLHKSQTKHNLYSRVGPIVLEVEDEADTSTTHFQHQKKK